MISFKKYSEYLEKEGYRHLKNTNDFFEPLWLQEHYFRNEKGYIYKVTVFCDLHKRPLIPHDNIAFINYGVGDGYGKPVKIDLRKKFWKQFLNSEE